MKVKEEFTRWASEYGKYNIIQERVADQLVSGIKDRPQRICDLGSGCGAVFSRINWSYQCFVGVDFSSEMRSLHPGGRNVSILNLDFNDASNFETLKKYAPFDIIVSSSSLQWCRDLENTLRHISLLSNRIAFAIFTSGTFKTINDVAGLNSILPDADDVENAIGHFFDVESEIRRYELSFPSAVEIFKYIKRSGVSGGERRLTYMQAKRLISTYPKDTLEFEVLFCS